MQLIIACLSIGLRHFATIFLLLILFLIQLRKLPWHCLGRALEKIKSLKNSLEIWKFNDKQLQLFIQNYARIAIKKASRKFHCRVSLSYRLFISYSTFAFHFVHLWRHIFFVVSRTMEFLIQTFPLQVTIISVVLLISKATHSNNFSMHFTERD